MPIRLADIYKDSKTVTFEYEGSEVTVEYRHNMLTPVMRVMLAAGSGYMRSRKHAEPEKPKPKGKGKRGQMQPEEQPPAPTPWWEQALAESDEYLGTLASILVSWDVLGDDGQPLPVTVEWLEQLPLSFINTIATAMLTDGLPNPLKGKDSPGTLPRTD